MNATTKLENVNLTRVLDNNPMVARVFYNSSWDSSQENVRIVVIANEEKNQEITVKWGMEESTGANLLGEKTWNCVNIEKLPAGLVKEFERQVVLYLESYYPAAE